jgi:hypothetical protein
MGLATNATIGVLTHRAGKGRSMLLSVTPTAAATPQATVPLAVIKAVANGVTIPTDQAIIVRAAAAQVMVVQDRGTTANMIYRT